MPNSFIRGNSTSWKKIQNNQWLNQTLQPILHNYRTCSVRRQCEQQARIVNNWHLDPRPQVLHPLKEEGNIHALLGCVRPLHSHTAVQSTCKTPKQNYKSVNVTGLWPGSSLSLWTSANQSTISRQLTHPAQVKPHMIPTSLANVPIIVL